MARFQSAKTLKRANVLSGWGLRQLKGGGERELGDEKVETCLNNSFKEVLI